MGSKYLKPKLSHLFAHLAAEYISLESNRTSLITVTGCEMSEDNKKARILYTVLPDSQEKAARDFLGRQSAGFKKYVKEKSKVGRLPQFFFVLDIGEKNRQKIDFLSNNE